MLRPAHSAAPSILAALVLVKVIIWLEKLPVAGGLPTMLWHALLFVLLPQLDSRSLAGPLVRAVDSGVCRPVNRPADRFFATSAAGYARASSGRV